MENSKMLVAINSEEMKSANDRLISIMSSNVNEIQKEILCLNEEIKIATKNKWRTSGLKRSRSLAIGRARYYQKIRSAIQHGYSVVPNFPGIQVIAIRTCNPKLPPSFTDSNYRAWSNDQEPKLLDEGHGKYIDPGVVSKTYDAGKDEKGKNKKDMFKDSSLFLLDG